MAKRSTGSSIEPGYRSFLIEQEVYRHQYDRRHDCLMQTTTNRNGFLAPIRPGLKHLNCPQSLMHTVRYYVSRRAPSLFVRRSLAQPSQLLYRVWTITAPGRSCWTALLHSTSSSGRQKQVSNLMLFGSSLDDNHQR
jgi:hypothetical protein